MNVCPECGLAYDHGGFCAQDGAQLIATTADPLLGTMVGPYRVAHLVGSGGMGRVYKGVNPTIRSRVAIKVLSHECAHRPDLIERFFAEARAVNLIRHESIVNVLDLSRLSDGRPYIVMEYLDGAPLGRLIAQRGRLPAGSLARLTGEVLAALGAAHAKGVVHRDIKPDNIFVTLQARAKILDFGIAKLAAEDRQGLDPTRAGSLLGTPHYMSPEQAQSRPADARADLYAVGVILYEGTTGRKPFTGGSVYEILRGHIELPPVAPRQMAPELPPAYEHVILRALAKDPAQRWQSADELSAALSAACHHLPPSEWDALTSRPRSESVGVATASGTPVGPPPTASRRRTGFTVALALLAIGAVAGGIGIALTAAGGGSEGQAILDAGIQSGAAASPASNEVETARASGHSEAESTAEKVVSVREGAQQTNGVGSPASTRPVGQQRSADEAPQPVPVKPPATSPTAALAAPDPGGGSAARRSQAENKRRRSLEERINEKNPNPAAWDVTGYLPKALAVAKTYFPDAVLVRIDADAVYPSGKANLELDTEFDVLYRFMSPSAAVRPKDLPLGVEHKPTCMLYVLVNRNEISVYTLQGWSCADEVSIRMPRCSAKEVWARAAAQGAPSDNAVAELSYRIFRGRPMWLFQIGKDHDHEIPDDC
jgi:serine/threonine protein kinase